MLTLTKGFIIMVNYEASHSLINDKNILNVDLIFEEVQDKKSNNYKF